MKPHEVGRSYDKLADRWDSAVFPQDYGVEQHERALAFLKQRRHALDIGCGGSGRIIELLTSHGFEVEGLDISRRMIEIAMRRHPDVIFHHADICQWEFPRRYDFISAWDSIWHIPLASQEPVMKKILQGLSPQGVCIFTAGGLDGPSEKVDRLFVCCLWGRMRGWGGCSRVLRPIETRRPL